MLNRLKIGVRLVLLIGVQTVVLAVIGITAIAGLRFATNTTGALNNNVIEQVKLNQLNEAVRADLLGAVNEVNNGKASWSQGRADLLAAKNLVLNNWDEYKADRTPAQVEQINTALGGEFDQVRSAMAKLHDLFAAEDQTALNDFVETGLPKQINPFLTELNERVNQQQLLGEDLFTESLNKSQQFLYSTSVIIAVGLLLAALLGFFIYRSIARPIRRISSTVSQVSSGDYSVRTDVTGRDELGELGQAFDELLEDKVATLVRTEKENEQLNESVISLLKAVSQLSQRDLTVRVPVTEDVTGPVADALNQLTTETSRVLQGVRRISEEVARASAKVKSQSDSVIAVANQEQQQVEETTQELSEAIESMNKIAELAQACNQAAEDAISTTQTALGTVTNTVEGINDIRQVIHETEKRIKRLGERSQEISRAVNLINSISERTHILALNASMHAASAGEAGRGFAVVADEVQRLAESARDATGQIATLVSNIQVETSDTVATMNSVISQVVEGSRLAEQAGEQMRQTRDSTANLVDSVRQIAERSQDQARASNELRTRADQIQESTRNTRTHLEQQTALTARLVQYAKGLLSAVQVFQLPQIEVVSSEQGEQPAMAAASAGGVPTGEATEVGDLDPVGDVAQIKVL